MSYRITYVPTKKDSEKDDGSALRVAFLSGAFLLLLGLMTAKYWPEGREVVERLISHSRLLSSRDALENLAKQLYWGVPVGEAVTAFCRDVIAAGTSLG